MKESNDIYKVIPWAKEAGLRLVEVNDDGNGHLWLYITGASYFNVSGDAWFDLDGMRVPSMFGYYKTEADALKNPPPYPHGFTPTYKLAPGPSMKNIGYSDVKDSGKRESFTTGSRRDTREGKGRFDLFSPLAMFRLARHYENGAVKYGDRNWEKGQPQSRFMDSAIRHLFKYLGGARDEDHLSAAAWNVMAMIHQEEQFVQERLDPSLNDLPTNQGVSLRPDVGLPEREPPVVPKDDKDLEGDVTDR